MRKPFNAMMLKSASLAAALLAVTGLASAATTTVNLTAQTATAALPDGSTVPMWALCTNDATTTAANAALAGGQLNNVNVCSTSTTSTTGVVTTTLNGTWAPGPTIVVPAGNSLTLKLNNTLPVPTSLTIVGQIGGTDTGAPNRAASPTHAAETLTTWPNNVAGSFTPPAQGSRARSFGPEAAAGTAATPGTATYSWTTLQPGTYLYQTGTHPSLQAPMGLYGVLIVTNAPVATTSTATPPVTTLAAGTAYPAAAGTTATLPPGTNAYGVSNAGVPYDADATFLLSEIDAVQNAAVDAAAKAGTSETLISTDPSCSAALKGGTTPCYPAAVNYRPTYFLINGSAFNPSNPAATSGVVADVAATGNVLVRFVNAGSRLHVPAISGLQMAVLSENGNLAPGFPKLQSEVNLPPGRTADVLVAPASNGTPGTTPVIPTKYTDKAYAVFDRALSTAGANIPNAGMHGYLAVAPAGTGATNAATNTFLATASGAAPVVTASTAAASYTFTLAPNVLTTFSGSVATNNVGLTGYVTGTAPAKGTLTWGTGGSFTYTPTTAPISAGDTFTYCTATAGCGTVTLALSAESATVPATITQTFTSTVSTLYRAITRSTGVLGGYTASDGYLLTAALTGTPTNCTVVLNADGSFSAAPSVRTGTTCTFSFTATDPRTKQVATGSATVNFPAPSNLNITVQDALNGVTATIPPVTDYMWIIQEDRSFRNATPGVSPSTAAQVAAGNPTPVLSTSFHNSHYPVVAVGCTGKYSCGDGKGGQKIQGTATPAAVYTSPADAVLDPTKNYYISILPGDAANPFTNGSSADPTASNSCLYSKLNAASPMPTDCGHSMGGANILYAAVPPATTPNQTSATVLVEPNPLKPAALSIFIFEDNSPTNNDYDANEIGLGGFEIIVNDVAGRSGDPVGQVTYDAFNMPLTNALLGVAGCPNETPSGAAALQQTNLVGVVYTCPDGDRRISSITATASTITVTTAVPHQFETSVQGAAPTIDISGVAAVPLNGSFTVKVVNPNTFTFANPGGVPAGNVQVWKSSIARDATTYQLAGQALINNIMPGRYDVLAHPAATREGAGETWYQVSTLEGTPGQDAFTKANEPNYFQEFGPPGFHTFIGWLNPAHIADQNAIALAQAAAAAPAGTAAPTTIISGRVTSLHMSRTVMETLWDSASNAAIGQSTCFVAVNQTGETGNDVAFTSCNHDGTFTLPPVPSGQQYELVIWDQWLDQIIAFQNLPANQVNPGTLAMGDIPVFSWFTRLESSVYMDLNNNGVRDPGEPGIPLVPVRIHFRDGSISNTLITDGNGNAVFNELFPLFNWYVVESDRVRYASTGVNVTVDAGGQPDCVITAKGATQGTLGTTSTCASTTSRTAGVANTQYVWTDPNTGLTYGAVPTGASTSTNRIDPGTTPYNGEFEGMQTFINQTEFLDFGRRNFAVGETGGIQGTVVYSSTRGFDDPTLQVQNLWEPGIPRVTLNLYKEQTNPDGTIGYVFVNTTTSTSWDDWANGVIGSDGLQYVLFPDNTLHSPVTGAPAPAGVTSTNVQNNIACPGQDSKDPFLPYSLGTPHQFKCYDGFHMWNQVQPAVFDGAYQFPGSWTTTVGGVTTTHTLTAGTYVVEVVPPPGYEIVKEEDKNILIGDQWVAPAAQQFGALTNIFITPDQASLASAYNPKNPGNNNTTLGLDFTEANYSYPKCVGTPHQVPDFMSLFPSSGQVAPFAGAMKNLCDRKEVVLNDQSTGIANFFLFTNTPRASHYTGLMLDDAAAEINAAAPDFGEKFAASYAPIAIRDFNGVEVSRVYTDAWGGYNGIIYSTWQVNVPNPAGYSPNMMVTCMNDPGPIPGPNGGVIVDPQYNPQYSNFCYTNPFMPGMTVYLDTPILPVAAFAAGYNPPDCALPASTPAIARVDGTGKGPWVAAAGGTITITALGDVNVPNSNYQGPTATTAPWNTKTLTRHYGFGATQGTGSVSINGTPLTVTGWSDTTITATIPTGVTTGELSIVSGNGLKSVDAVTVTVGGPAPVVVEPAPNTAAVTGNAHPIQDAIDAAKPGDLIIVDAGQYPELVVMWKPVRLQGVGAASVVISAAKYPTQKLQNWRPVVNRYFGVDTVLGNQVPNSQVDPLPNQEITGGIVLLEPSVLATEEGAGITVLGKNPASAPCGSTATSSYPDQVLFPPTSNTVKIINSTHAMSESNYTCAPSRIDGISVTGGDSGGGIYVNGWASGLEIANNRVYGNAGSFNGGIRVGVPYLEALTSTQTAADGTVFGYDVGVHIHHNVITNNGTVEANPGAVNAANSTGVGGGLSICTGTDNYVVNYNFICGNYSAGDGGGIGQTGVSNNGLIAENTIIFNQSYQQTAQVNGGGIVIEGELGAVGGTSLGTGSVTIDRNIIRGNFSQGGHGGGIRLQQVNGSDVATNPTTPANWYTVTITNNMITNNVSGWAGAGISAADALKVDVSNNTIANNDSMGIVGAMIGTNPLNQAAPLAKTTGYPAPAGVSVDRTTTALLTGVANASAYQYAGVTLYNDILWQNRSFYFAITAQANTAGVQVPTNTLCPSNTVMDAYSLKCTPLPAQTAVGQCVTGAAYWDLGTTDDASSTPGSGPLKVALNPTYSVLSGTTTGYAGVGNVSGDPGFTQSYCNGARANPAFIFEPGQPFLTPAAQNLTAGATLDEAGNFVDVRFGPLYLFDPTTSTTTSPGTVIGNYHLAAAAGAAYNVGGTITGHPVTLRQDIDGDGRPAARTTGSGVDIGADEYAPPGSQVVGAIPTSLTFGNVQTGQFATQTFTVTNDGSSASVLTFGPMVASGHFTPTNNCGTGIAVGQSCQFTITFQPLGTYKSPTAETGSIVITDNSTNMPSFTIAVSGVAYPPAAAVPASGALGNLEANAVIVKPVTVTNTGVGPWFFVGTGSIPAGSAFKVLPTNPGTCASYQYGSTGTGLPVGASCTVNVTVTVPGDGNNSNGTLTVSETANLVNVATGLSTPTIEQTITQTVRFSVAGVQAQFDFTDNPNFGTVTVGQTSAVRTVTLTNTSGIPISFAAGDFVLSGANASSFALVGNTCTAAPIANGRTCVLSFTFTPVAVGAETATLAVSPGGVAVGTIALRGTGRTPVALNVAVATLTPATGSTTASRTFTLTNTGTSAFTPTSFFTLATGSTSALATGGTGTGTILIAAGGTCSIGTPVAPNGGSCTVNVTFTATAASTTKTVTANLGVTGTLASGGTYSTPTTVITGN